MSSMLINTRALPLRKSVVTAPFRLYPEGVKKNYATELWHAGEKAKDVAVVSIFRSKEGRERGLPGSPSSRTHV